MKPSRNHDLIYSFCNIRLLHWPNNIATRATQTNFKPPPKCTHDMVIEDKINEDEDEWEVDFAMSNIEDIDGFVEVLNET